MKPTDDAYQDGYARGLRDGSNVTMSVALKAFCHVLKTEHGMRIACGYLTVESVERIMVAVRGHL